MVRYSGCRAEENSACIQTDSAFPAGQRCNMMSYRLYYIILVHKQHRCLCFTVSICDTAILLSLSQQLLSIYYLDKCSRVNDFLHLYGHQNHTLCFHRSGLNMTESTWSFIQTVHSAGLRLPAGGFDPPRELSDSGVDQWWNNTLK